MDASASLWRHPDFVKLWSAQTISQIGSQVTFLALPLTAITVLDASPAQMGLLTAAGAVPAVVFGLQAGAVVDRRARRPVLISTDLARAATLAVIPTAWALGVLSVPLLIGVALAVGAGSLLFDVAYQALLPAVVPRDRLLDGNGKLELSRTAAELGGPGLAGLLLHLVTAPVAIAVDAASFLASALILMRLRVVEQIPASAETAQRMLADVRDGLRAVAADDRLRAVAGSRGLLGFFNAMLEAVFVLYLVREVGLSPLAIGLVFAVGSGGFLVGAVLPGRLAARVGIGPGMAAAVGLVAASDLAVAAAGRSPMAALPALAAAQFCFGIGLTVYNVNQASLRQAIVASHLQGRAAATIRFVAETVVPAGALIGGLLGGWIGVWETLVLAAAGEGLAALWLWHSPLRALHALPLTPDHDVTGESTGGSW